MPNWTNNNLHIEGPKEDLRKFLQAGRAAPEYYFTHGWADEEERDKPRFSFSGIYPIPEPILRAHSIQSATHEKDMERWRQACEAIRAKHPGKKNEELRLPGFSEFVSPDYDQQAMEAWYHWSVEAWGTKWDINPNAQIHDNTDLDAASIEMSFDTAWSPPVPWLTEAARQFPSLTFRLEYEELGMCFAGEAVAEDGRLVKDEYHDMTAAEMRARHPDWDWDEEECVNG